MDMKENQVACKSKQIVLKINKKAFWFAVASVFLAAISLLTLIFVNRPKEFKITNFDIGQYSRVIRSKWQQFDVAIYQMCPDSVDGELTADFSVYANGRLVDSDEVNITVKYIHVEDDTVHSSITYNGCYGDMWLVEISVSPKLNGKYKNYNALVYYAMVRWHDHIN